MRQQKYYEAYLDDFHKVTVYLSKNSYDGLSNKFYLKDRIGNMFDLHIQSIEETPNNYNKYTLLLYGDIEIGNEYYVVHQHARSEFLQYSYIVKQNRFDELFYYDGTDLGYTYHAMHTAFALWAPTAYRVKLDVQKNGVMNTYEMQRTKRGVFRFTIPGDLENATYVYLVRVNGAWREAIDPYGIASNENSKRSAVIDPMKMKIHDYELPDMASVCDSVIYEASVRDFTISTASGVAHAGKFLGFIEENELTRTKNTGFSYLKSLGITHVQLMPVFDFGSVDEVYPLLHYNWGYDPVQYRVLDGSFCDDPSNPYERIFGFLALVEACHKQGIRVNVDVVFNHMYDKELSSFDNIVPNYYFQMDEHGAFSNATSCGNDIDTNRKMCAKFVVDTCVFLVKAYHIDGFRFDLMGILDVDTMNAVEQACRAINPDFMIYGEGWDMPSFLGQEQRACILNNARMPFIGHFSDRFRDVVKGRTSTDEVGYKGYVTGATYLIDIMKNCLSASCVNVGMEALFLHPRNVVNYVECHDNMTSWDKIKECCKEDSEEVCIAKHKMLIAACLVAQGIPFLHCGQEFARTKHGLPNTYEESDEINHIDYHRRNQYQDIVNCTKNLIAIRKQYACLRYHTREQVEAYVSFDEIAHSVLLYRMKDGQEDMIVVFNPTNTRYSYHLPEVYGLIYYNMSVSDSSIQQLVIEPYSTVIVYRKCS